MTAPTRPKAVTYGQDASVARFSVPRYQEMIRQGILDVNDHVELLENYLVLKMARNPKHDAIIQRYNRALLKYLPANWDIRIQSAVTLSDSQPEPDLAIVRGSFADYEHRHPLSTQIGIIIEVADSSLMRDRYDKNRIYARAGIPIYWIVNLVDYRIEVYTQPSGPSEDPSYASCDMFTIEQSIPFVLDANSVATIPASELLSLPPAAPQP